MDIDYFGGLFSCPFSAAVNSPRNDTSIRFLMHVYIWLCIHSSSASSLAELRLPGSHCSILRMKCKNASLSTFPSRVVSLSSSGSRCVNKSGVRKAPGHLVSGFGRQNHQILYLPLFEKNLSRSSP